jgi:hypothetical protein
MLAICGLGFALPAAAQLDSCALRAKYGSPLNRETFHTPAGFDLVVDYGTGNQVCKLEMPALMPVSAGVSRESERNQRMHDFLADLVPPSIRGEELGRMAQVQGVISVTSIDYAHVSISEMQSLHRDQDTVTVMFKDYDCQRLAANNR